MSCVNQTKTIRNIKLSYSFFFLFNVKLSQKILKSQQDGLFILDQLNPSSSNLSVNTLATQKKVKYRREGKSRCCCLGGRNLIHFCFALAILHQDDFKKRMNRITATWRNECFERMDDQQAHTTLNHHPPKMDVLQKTFLQIILAAKWLVRHSRTSPKHQRRPLPSLLPVSS